jgi:hypothetical protein
METTIKLTEQQLEYVREVMRRGLWGKSVNEVVLQLFMDGLRRAAAQGHFKPWDNGQEG